MRRFVWVSTWVAVALWSLVAWSLYGMLELGTTVLTGGAGLAPPPPGSFTTGDPPLLEPLFPLFSLAKSFGFAATVLVWGAVSAVMVGGAWILTRFMPRPKPTGTYSGTYTLDPPRRPTPRIPQHREHADVARDLVERFTKRRR
jgi:hypothetical protein